jgi:amino acid transporter
VVLHFGTTSILLGVAFLVIGVIVGWAVRNQWIKFDQELAEIRRKKPWVTTAAIAVLIACLPILIVLYAAFPPSSAFDQIEFIILFMVVVIAIIGWGIKERRKQ